MQQAKELLEQGRIMEALALYRHTEKTSAYDPAERVREQAADYNATEGDLHLQDGITCDACKNKGWIAVADGVSSALAFCQCTEQRKSVKRMRRSGLGDMLDRYTLDRFTRDTSWHQIMAERADAYLAGVGGWFYVGGQNGCGKTHLGTAICSELLKRGQDVRYMLWRKESAKLKSLVNEPEYGPAMADWDSATVLYIDDLFKQDRQKRPNAPPDLPTPADIRLAFELLNNRYNDTSKRTIISSEWMLDELMDFDEGIQSRIRERSKGFCVEIGRSPDRNYRITGGVAV